MFQFFKSNKNHKQNAKPNKKDEIQMVDVEGKPLKEGDIVMSLRYELGKCKILTSENGFEYESLDTGERVHYLKMVDASTSFQKVRKL